MNRCFLLLCFLPFSLSAQYSTSEFYVNNVRAILNTNGFLFNGYGNSQHGFEVPAGFGNHTLYNNTLWISGTDSLGEIHVAAMTYCVDDIGGLCEYYPGPLTADGTATTTPEVTAEFNYVRLISRWRVEIHMNYFNCINNPDCDETVEFPGGYTTHSSLLNWPGQGNADAGYAANLAPYVDYNGDGFYTPEEGDYPDFCGDFAAYIINNDNGGPHLESGGTPLGVEVHTMVYVYNEMSNTTLFTSVFVHQDIINRSLNTYDNTVLSVWSDFDIGNYEDDFIGTDVERSMIYGYNGDDFDDPNISGQGYGSNLAAAACVILAGPYADADGLDNEIPYEGYERYGNYTTGWGDGIVDNERLGLNGSMAYLTLPVETSLPTNPQEFHNTQRAIWKDGTPQTYGGNGYDSDNPLINSRYIFPGNSDPELSGTDGVDPTYVGLEGWTEVAEEMIPADRRMVGSTGSFQFKPGDMQSLDYVYIFARQSQDPETELLDILRSRADEISAYQCDVHAGTITSTSDLDQKKIIFQIFPNPTSGEFVINSPVMEKGSYTIFNTLGGRVAQGNLETGTSHVNVSQLPKGIYVVQISQGIKTGAQKLVVY